jgi:hypothetical protein
MNLDVAKYITRNQRLLEGKLWFLVKLVEYGPEGTTGWTSGVSKLHVKEKGESSWQLSLTNPQKAGNYIFAGCSPDKDDVFEIVIAAENWAKSSVISGNPKIAHFELETYSTAPSAYNSSSPKLFWPTSALTNAGFGKSADDGNAPSTHFYLTQSDTDMYWVKATSVCAPRELGYPAGDNDCASILPCDTGRSSYPASRPQPVLPHECAAGGTKRGGEPSCNPHFIEIDPENTADLDWNYMGAKPGSGDVIQIDKNGPNSNGKKTRQCYKVNGVYTSVEAAKAAGCTNCSEVADESGTRCTKGGVGTAPFSDNCLRIQHTAVKALAPGSSCNQCGDYDKFNITYALIKSLSSMGWGENIGGFRVSEFAGTLEQGDTGYMINPYIKKMTAHGHLTRERQSLVTGATNSNFKGGHTWNFADGDPNPWIDSVRVHYLLDVSKTDTVTFVDRWRQTIEMSGRRAQPSENGTDGTVWELTRAWDPVLLEMFAEKVTHHAAALRVKADVGRNFEVGFNVSGEYETMDSDGSYGETRTSGSISASAFVTFKNLGKIIQKGENWADDIDEGGIREDVLSFTFNFGQYSFEESEKKYIEGTGQLTDGTVQDKTKNQSWKREVKDTLFQMLTVDVKYDITFYNGWRVGITGISIDASGKATSINPTFTVSNSTFMDDQLSLTATVDSHGAFSLGVGFTSNPFWTPAVSRSIPEGGIWPHTIIFDSGISIADDGTHEISAGFSGKVGAPARSGFENILAGFEWDVNAAEGVGRISRAVNLHEFHDDSGKVIGKVDFSLKANSDPEQTSFQVGLDADYTKSVVSLGEIWGDFVIKGRLLVGIKAGMPGAGGLTNPGTSIGIYGGVGVTWKNNILEWLGFPFNIHPGIGATFGAKFVFGAKSTYGTTGGGYTTYLSLGGISWEFAAADTLRHHLSRMHRSYIAGVPILGCLSISLPILKRLGRKETITAYMIRAAMVRSNAALISSVKKAIEDADAAKLRIQSQWRAFYRGLTLHTADWQKHNNFCYEPCASKTEGPLANLDDVDDINYQSNCYCKCSWKWDSGTSSPTFCGTVGGGNATNRHKNGPHATATEAKFFQNCETLTGKATAQNCKCKEKNEDGDDNENCLQCGFNSKWKYEYDKWMSSYDACGKAHTLYKDVLDSKWYAWDFTKFKELRGMQGITEMVVQTIEDYMWQSIFVEGKHNSGVNKTDEFNENYLTQTMVEDWLEGIKDSSTIFGKVRIASDGAVVQIVDNTRAPDDAPDAPGFATEAEAWTHQKGLIKDSIFGGKRASILKWYDKYTCIFEAWKKIKEWAINGGLCDATDFRYKVICEKAKENVCIPPGYSQTSAASKCQRAYDAWYKYIRIYAKEVERWANMLTCKTSGVMCNNSNYPVTMGAYQQGIITSIMGSAAPALADCHQMSFWKVYHELYKCGPCLRSLKNAQKMLEEANPDVIIANNDCYEDQDGNRIRVYVPTTESADCLHQSWSNTTYAFTLKNFGLRALEKCPTFEAARDEEDEEKYSVGNHTNAAAVAKLHAGTWTTSLKGYAKTFFGVEASARGVGDSSDCSGGCTGAGHAMVENIALIKQMLIFIQNNRPSPGHPTYVSYLISDPFFAYQTRGGFNDPGNSGGNPPDAGAPADPDTFDANPGPTGKISPIFEHNTWDFDPTPSNTESGYAYPKGRRAWDNEEIKYNWLPVWEANNPAAPAEPGYYDGNTLIEDWMKCKQVLARCCLSLPDLLGKLDVLQRFSAKLNRNIAGGPSNFNYDNVIAICKGDLKLFQRTLRIMAAKWQMIELGPAGTIIPNNRSMGMGVAISTEAYLEIMKAAGATGTDAEIHANYPNVGIRNTADCPNCKNVLDFRWASVAPFSGNWKTTAAGAGYLNYMATSPSQPNQGTATNPYMYFFAAPSLAKVAQTFRFQTWDNSNSKTHKAFTFYTSFSEHMGGWGHGKGHCSNVAGDPHDACAGGYYNSAYHYPGGPTSGKQNTRVVARDGANPRHTAPSLQWMMGMSNDLSIPNDIGNRGEQNAAMAVLQQGSLNAPNGKMVVRTGELSDGERNRLATITFCATVTIKDSNFNMVGIPGESGQGSGTGSATSLIPGGTGAGTTGAMMEGEVAGFPPSNEGEMGPGGNMGGGDSSPQNNTDPEGNDNEQGLPEGGSGGDDGAAYGGSGFGSGGDYSDPNEGYRPGRGDHQGENRGRPDSDPNRGELPGGYDPGGFQEGGGDPAGGQGDRNTGNQSGQADIDADGHGEDFPGFQGHPGGDQ